MPIEKTLLTSDKMPWMVMLFGFPAGLCLIVAGLFASQVYGTFHALGNGAPDVSYHCSSGYPVVCTEGLRSTEAKQQMVWVVVLLVAMVVLWQTGFRYRHVWVEGDEVRIVWGERLPMTLRRFRVSELSGFEMKKEERFAVTPRVGTSTSRVQRMPDRWRLTASCKGKRANLGSYASEADAQQAVRRITMSV